VRTQGYLSALSEARFALESVAHRPVVPIARTVSGSNSSRKDRAMARRCSLTGKDVQFGHNVSHSKRATNRRFDANIQKVTLRSEVLGRPIPMRIAARTLRTVQKKGGIDGFLLGTADQNLMPEAIRLIAEGRVEIRGGRCHLRR